MKNEKNAFVECVFKLKENFSMLVWKETVSKSDGVSGIYSFSYI